MTRTATPFLLAFLLAAACAPDQRWPDEAVRADTLEGEIVEGVSPQELGERAEPVTAEEARRRGEIDTTIYVEPLDPDTLLDTIPRRPPPPDL